MGTAGGSGGRRGHWEEKIQGFSGRFERNTGMRHSKHSTQKRSDENSDLSQRLGIDEEKLKDKFLSWHIGFSAIGASVEIPFAFL